jgi:hypothetical protein
LSVIAFSPVIGPVALAAEPLGLATQAFDLGPRGPQLALEVCLRGPSRIPFGLRLAEL